MKTLKHSLLTAALTFLLFSFFTNTAKAQLQVELTGGVGFTGMDMYSWSGSSSLWDWNQFSVGGELTVFALQKGQFQLGVEGGFQHFGWYEVQRKTDYSTYYRWYDINAPKAFVVVRTNLTDHIFSELAAGTYFFDGWMSIGIQGAIGYRFHLNEHWSIPVKVRGGIIFDSDANMFPVNLKTGVAYTF